jgi:hypothetical protein
MWTCLLSSSQVLVSLSSMLCWVELIHPSTTIIVRNGTTHMVSGGQIHLNCVRGVQHMPKPTLWAP